MTKKSVRRGTRPTATCKNSQAQGRSARKRRKAPYSISIPKGFEETLRDKLFIDLRWHCKTLKESPCEEWSLLNMTTRPYLSPQTVAARRQASSILDKFDPGTSNPALEQACIDDVIETNAACKDICLRKWRRMLNGKSEKLDPVFERARKLIKRVIGSAPSLEDIVWFGRHGPGSTAGFSRDRSSRFQKWNRLPMECLPYCRDLLPMLVDVDPHVRSSIEERFRQQIGDFSSPLNWERILDCCLDPRTTNTVITVPKTATKRRPIAKEPMLGVYFQLGVDHIIRTGLRRFGIDLDNQQPNREAAILGSLNDLPESPATIDLSAASDTIALKVVKELVPLQWYELLMKLRSTAGILPTGERLPYWKISSMGNGYTFALESLLFWAIARATVDRFGSPRDRVLTYGDDIVVPGKYAPLTMHYLRRAGCRVNSKKSFIRGPVRESCGVDAYMGVNVRPVYLRRPVRTVQDLFSIRNRLYRWARFHGFDLPVTDSWLASLARGLHLTFAGPEDDEEFESTWHTQQPPKRRPRWSYQYSALERRRKSVQEGTDWADYYTNLICAGHLNDAGAVRTTRKGGVLQKVKRQAGVWNNYQFLSYLVESPARGELLALRDIGL